MISDFEQNIFGETEQENFDNQSEAESEPQTIEEQLDLMLAEGTRQEVRTLDANLPRYGMALLLDIPLIDSTPYFFLGDFNIKHQDRRLGNKINIPYFPRLALFPFTTQTFDIPYEGKATLLSEEEAEQIEADEFNVATVESTVRNAKKQRTISALSFATQVFEAYKHQGFTMFDALTGIGHGEEIERYRTAALLVKTVITANAVQDAFPQSPRERFGFAVNPPFMPEIIRYLREVSTEKALKQKCDNQSDFDKLLSIRAALLKGALISQNYCEKTLAHTEAQIEAKEKKGYDLPNFTHKNAKPPRDLVAMIHLNRQPLKMQSLEIAKTAGQAVAAGMGANQPSAEVVSPDVEAILKKQQQNFDKNLQKQRQEFDKRFQEQQEQFESVLEDLKNEVLATSAPKISEPQQETEKQETVKNGNKTKN